MPQTQSVVPNTLFSVLWRPRKGRYGGISYHLDKDEVYLPNPVRKDGVLLLFGISKEYNVIGSQICRYLAVYSQKPRIQRN